MPYCVAFVSLYFVMGIVVIQKSYSYLCVYSQIYNTNSLILTKVKDVVWTHLILLNK